LWKKARREEVPFEQGESLLEDGGSDYEEGSQSAERYALDHREVDGDVDEEESWNQPDYASNHREVDGDVEEESRNQPDTASNHSEVVEDAGSQVAWDEASRRRSGCTTPPQGEYWSSTARPQAASRKKKARRCRSPRKGVSRSWIARR
jgi:hypothetical protein